MKAPQFPSHLFVLFLVTTIVADAFCPFVPSRKSRLQNALIIGSESKYVHRYILRSGTPFPKRMTTSVTERRSSPQNEDNSEKLDTNKKESEFSTTPQQLGFDLPKKRRDLGERQNVRVDLVDDVDSVTLTAVGFGLIALNFLVFANLGDGGIAGLVATIINTLKD